MPIWSGVNLEFLASSCKWIKLTPSADFDQYVFDPSSVYLTHVIPDGE